MSVIIRLQNLPWSADAQDIRDFFKGLAIPEGGVHIVGGELGDAFIAFSSDEDARLGMQKTGGSLKGIQISLLLSSRSEMQKVIETARQQAMGIQTYIPPTPAPPVVQQPPVQPQFHQPPPPTVMQSLPPQRPQPPDEHIQHQNPPNPNVMFQDRSPMHGQPFPQQPFGTQPPQFMPNHQMPFQGQRLNAFPPGVVAPGMLSNQFFSQPPPGATNSPSGAPPSRIPNAVAPSPPTTTQSYVPTMPQPQPQPQSNFPAPPTQALIPQPPSGTPPQPVVQVDPSGDKRDRKAPSSSSSSSRDKRERDKSRDERRRRSKSRSRSRSRDRERRRRHRTRSRSRSRDRGGRRKRTRSRERDRTRDKERDRQREREKGGRSSHRDRSERPSQEPQEAKVKASDSTGGIPGLGDIPDDIPKDGLSIFAAPSNTPVQSQEPLTSSGWPRRESSLPRPGAKTFDKAGPPDLPHHHQQQQQQQQQQPQQHHLHHQPPPPPMSGSSKPFLLANPATVTFGATPNPPPPNSSSALMGASSNSRSFNESPSSYRDEERFDDPKEPLLQLPKDRPPSSGFSEERRDWGPEPFDSRRHPRDDDRPYRNNQDNSRGGDRGDRPSGGWGRSDWDSPKDIDKPSMPREDWGKPFSSRRDDEYEYPRERDNNNSWNAGSHHDRRDHHPYSSRGGPYQDDYRPDYDDRFSRGGFRGRGRRGGFGGGREMDREMDLPPRGHGNFRDDDPPYRDRYQSDFDGGPRGRGGRGFMRGRGGRLPPSNEFSRERRVKTCCVEVLHVPNSASYRAIRDFFSGIPIQNGSIKILGDQSGNRIGVALLQFPTARDAFEAFKRSGQCIYDSRVQVNFIDEGFYRESRDIREFNEVRQRSPEIETVEEINIISPCLYVSCLPVGCTDHDVGRVFQDHEVEEIVLQFEKGSRQPTGGCFVRFSSPDEAKLAFSKMENANIDGAPIKVEICPLEPMEEAIREREKIRTYKIPQKKDNVNPPEIGTKELLKALSESKKNSGKSQPIEIHDDDMEEDNDDSNSNGQNGDNNITIGADLLTDSVVVKNISSDITETSIRDFFSDEGLVPEKVYFNRPDSEGKCDVFVIFPKISDAKRALDKDSQQLGSTKVTVELVSKPMVMVAMGLPFNPLELFQKGQTEANMAPMPAENALPESLETNDDNDFRMPPEAPKRDSSRYDPPPPFRGRGYHNRFPPRGHDAPYGGGGGGGGGYRHRHPPSFRKEQDGHYSSDRKSYDDRVISNGKEIVKISEPPENFGKPGCVVALSNVPYQATTDDILIFFKDFEDLQPENIIRRYDEKNRPTADSRVSLSSSDDAIRAVETLNKRYMLSRPIFVSLVN